MDEAKITVKPDGTIVRLSTTSRVVTITNNGTRIKVPPREVNLLLVYAPGSLDGIKIAESRAGLPSAPVLGKTIGGGRSEVRNSAGVPCFLIERAQKDTMDVIDVAQERGTWYFQLSLDGTWYDPQIYNKGN